MSRAHRSTHALATATAPAWFWLFTFMVVSTTTTTAVTAATVDERAVLLQLYEATGGKAWHNNYGWAENLPNLCDWTGVICDAQDLAKYVTYQHDRDRQLQSDISSNEATVRGLRLKANDLSGRTPESLWTLPLLQYLDVSQNTALSVTFAALEQAELLQVLKLSDTATDTITGISNARATLLNLHVSGSPLESAVPDELFQLTWLKELHVRACALRGTISDDIRKLSHLELLNMADNSLTGTLPDGMGQLVHLRDLSIAHNMLHGQLPDYLQDFVLLEALSLHNNQFTGPVPSLSSQPKLRSVRLHENYLIGTVPDDFLAQMATEGQYFASNVGDDEIARSNAMIHVDLSGNQLTGMSSSLDQLQNLLMDWLLRDNLITSIPTELCDNVNWNNGMMATAGCDAMLCPAGTFSPYGRAMATFECLECPSVKFMGSTLCLDQDDYSILKDLFVATGGELSWKNRTGWMQDKLYCAWHGITCGKNDDETDGRVIGIDLVNNGLEGIVPATIFNLQYLRHISFSHNRIELSFDLLQSNSTVASISITSTLTTKFSGLEKIAHKNLEYLYADRLPIQGTLPTEILAVNTLKVLSMSECDIKGVLNTNLGSMGALEELFLFDNQIKGPIPTEIGKMQNLRVLSLAKNQLTGMLPSHLELMPNLQALSLTDQVTKGGGLVGRLLSFADSKNLTSLMLGNNVLEGTIPENLLSNINLDSPVTISLHNNRISGRVPGSLAKFESLNLYLQGNEITELDHRLCAMDNWMGGLVKAYGCDAILCPAGSGGGRQVYADLACQQCSVNATKSSSSSSSSSVAAEAQEEDEWFGRMQCGLGDDILSELGILKLLYRECGGVDWHSKDKWMTDAHFCTWSGVTCNDAMSVKTLNLGSNQLLGDFPTDIYMLPNLEKLVLFNNEINFNFEGIEKATNLKSLILDSTGLPSLRGLGSARALEELSVRLNKLIGEIPQDLSRLVNLKSLTISDNSLTGDIPYWISSLSRLESFKAASNMISGHLYDFADMTQLSYVDLSNNRLSGSVPSTLLERASKIAKIVVDLTGNQLSGTIPPKLASFSKLSLHLTDNKISEIGGGLCSMVGWLDNDVDAYGCDGILCPAGMANSAGRQTSDTNPCVKCDAAKYMGSTACIVANTSSAFRSAPSTVLWLGSIICSFAATAVLSLLL